MNNLLKGNNYGSTMQCISFFEISGNQQTGSGFYTKKELYKNSKKNYNTADEVLKKFKGEIVNFDSNQYFLSVKNTDLYKL